MKRLDGTMSPGSAPLCGGGGTFTYRRIKTKQRDLSVYEAWRDDGQDVRSSFHPLTPHGSSCSSRPSGARGDQDQLSKEPLPVWALLSQEEGAVGLDAVYVFSFPLGQCQDMSVR